MALDPWYKIVTLRLRQVLDDLELKEQVRVERS